MRRLLIIVAALLVSPIAVAGSPGCEGEFRNPITAADWKNLFPITVGGVTISGGGRSNPPLMRMDPICMCPGAFGNVPGIGMTYWQPAYLAEVQRTAGCTSSLGGTELLPGFEHQNSQGADTQGVGSVRRQVHWYRYPLFSILGLFNSLACKMTGGFSLLYISEVDVTWQDDAYAAVVSPLTILFAMPLAVLSCMPDAVASAAGHPIDALYWCAGTEGVVYPSTGNAQNFTSPATANMHILHKAMMRMHQDALLLGTIGPWAQCSNFYLPFWLKSQYRFDIWGPVSISTSRPIVAGASEFTWALSPPANTPKDTSNDILVWVGTQCCVRY